MLFSSLFRHRPRRSIRRPRWVPRLEALEDRIALSTLTVTSAADDGSAGTLRVVLSEAHNGDTIKFAHQLDGQTITLTQGQLTVNQSVNISGPGASKLAISGNAAIRIFDIGSGANVSISGLTLTDGLATDGGGILNTGTLTLCQDTISGNIAQGTAANGGNAFGGGIYNQGGSVTIEQSALNGNQAIGANGGSGGVVVPLPGGSSVTLLDDGMGGGVWNEGGSLIVTNSTLSNNLAQGGSNGDGSQNTTQYLIVGSALGGAIGSGAFFATQTPNLAISGSSLSNNNSQGGSNLLEAIPIFPNPLGLAAAAGNGYGGAVGAAAGNLSLTHSTIHGNTAEGGNLVTDVQGSKIVATHGSTGLGGGISDEYELGFTNPAAFPSLNIQGSILQGNTALGNGPSGFASGGGLDTTNVAVQVSNSTVSGNQAMGGPGGGFAFISTTSGFTFTLNNGGGGASGGGIASSAGSLTIAASVLENNVAQGGPGIVKAVTGTFFFGGKPGYGGDATGGGIYSSGQALDLTTATLSGNQSLGGTAIKGFNVSGSADAGALEMSGDTATISGTAFRNNLARAGVGGIGGDANGGGAVGNGGSLQLTDSTFTGNQAISQGVTQGGGLAIFGTNFTLSNTLFTGNLAQGSSAGGEGVGGGLDVVEFNSNSGTSPTVSNCSFVQNTAQGGGDGEGGGMFISGRTTMTIQGSTFVADKAVGGNNVFQGQGGFALGGGIDIDFLSNVQVTNCSFRFDAAIGGNGGAGSSASPAGGAGGFAAGGGVQADYGSTATISNASFYANLAQGGAGGAGANGGAGGTGGLGQGGALANDGATTNVSNSSFVLNAAVGGVGGTGGTGAVGGAGGAGQGGGIYSTPGFFGTAVLNISNSLVALNLAQGDVGGAGGAGSTGGNGGDGDGGGIFNDAGSTATVLTSTIVGNAAVGGAAGSGGSAGQGVGGGVYNLGTFDVDAATVIADNYASTSEDNEYGTITLI